MRASALIVLALIWTGCEAERRRPGAAPTNTSGQTPRDTGVDDSGAENVDSGFANDASALDVGGEPDRGVVDVGFPDPPDLGPPDRGFIDVGFPDPPDLGPPDRGFVDVGFVDVGFPDRGFVDQGFPDAGFRDASPTDAGPGYSANAVQSELTIEQNPTPGVDPARLVITLEFDNATGRSVPLSVVSTELTLVIANLSFAMQPTSVNVPPGVSQQTFSGVPSSTGIEASLLCLLPVPGIGFMNLGSLNIPFTPQITCN